ncbi:852_t:CDS:2, partial [Gigaspora margarita]
KNIQEISDEKEHKEVLLITECGISDYSTKEVQKQLTENKVAGLAKHNNLIETIVLDKMEVDQDKEGKGFQQIKVQTENPI